jgi:phosphate transport system protein
MAPAFNLVHKKRVQIQQGVSDLGRLVIEALERSIACLSSQDLALAGQIIAGDQVINQRRRAMEQECLVALAAFKPAGADLRCIGASLSLVSELERIGDYAADVARIVRLARGGGSFPTDTVAAVTGVAANAIAMLRDALAAFSAGADARDARATVAREQEIDEQERVLDARILEMMRADPDFTPLGTYLLWIVHNYERAADRATNVAEQVVYIASGEIEELG